MKLVPPFQVILSIFVIAGLSITMLNAAPVAVVGIPLPATAREQIQKVVPQGWGFFTRSPREPFIQAYANNDLDLPLIKMPSAKIDNLFGISRYGRGQPVEMANIINIIKPEDWKECGPELSHCASSFNISTHESHNSKRNPSLCGDVLFIQQSPTPWAYRNLSDSETVAEKAVRTLIDCP